MWGISSLKFRGGVVAVLEGVFRIAWKIRSEVDLRYVRPVSIEPNAVGDEGDERFCVVLV